MERSPPKRVPSLISTPKGGDVGDVGGEGFPRQAIWRDAIQQHAARLRLGLEDGHLVAGQGQIVGRGEAGWPRADDGHLLARRRGNGIMQASDSAVRSAARSADCTAPCSAVSGMVGREALEAADSHRLPINLGAPAG